MAYQQKDNNGSLWRNDKKTEAKHPDYTGSIKIAGVEYWLAAWLNETEAGKKYLGIKANPKEEEPPAPREKYLEPKGGLTAELDDEIPF